MKKLFDKLILKSFWVQLAALIGLIVILASVFLLFSSRLSLGSEVVTHIEKLITPVPSDSLVSQQVDPIKSNAHTPPPVKDRVWFIVSRLIDPGYLNDSEDKLFTLIVTILGWILCGGIMIAIITNAYFERIKKLENGLVRYKFKNHYILFGYNSMTADLIQQIYNWKGYHTNEVIVIHSDQDATTIRAALRASINHKILKNIYIYRGDRSSQEELSKLGLEHAKLAIVTNETNETGSDAKNIDCFDKAARMIRSKKNDTRKIPFYVYFNESQTFRIAKDFNVDPDYNDCVSFYPISFYEQWSKHIFVNFATFFNDEPIYPPLDQEPITKNSNLFVDLYILGYNKMSLALITQAARICHFPNKEKTVISVIDKKASEIEQTFNAEFRGKDRLDDLEIKFYDYDVYSEDTHNLFHHSINNPQAMTYIAVCFSDPDFALSVGLSLPLEIFTQRIPLLIRQNDNHNLHKNCHPNVWYFGMQDKNFIFDDMTDIMASKANETYNALVNKPDSFTHHQHQLWDDLSETYKWANRYLVDSYPIKLRSLHLSEKNIGKGQANELISSETEHRRWMAERVMSGWTYGDKRNDRLKVHPLLVPYKTLNQDEIEKDKMLHAQVVKTMINLKSEYDNFKRYTEAPETYVKTANIRAKKLDNTVTINSLENSELTGKKGEYLCIGSEGEQWIMTENNITEKYLLIPASADNEGFSTYKPIQDKHIVSAKRLTTKRAIRISANNILYGKIGDMLLQPLAPGNTSEQWIVDADIFSKTYVKVNHSNRVSKHKP
ncbi:RyR domain-containing protein [Saccharicrinis sp. FJH2]|uniref:RyR domain-containing protein n=1 Tax=Saccharicrinis sp. FJH65 TaxID=3344659 RepID=UPI0035F2DBA1